MPATSAARAGVASTGTTQPDASGKLRNESARGTAADQLDALVANLLPRIAEPDELEDEFAGSPGRQPRFGRLQLRADLRRGPGDGEALHHLIRHGVGYLVPVLVLCLLGTLPDGLGVGRPPGGFGDSAVTRRREVERELTACLPYRRIAVLRHAGDNLAGEVGNGSATACAFLQGGIHGL